MRRWTWLGIACLGLGLSAGGSARGADPYPLPDDGPYRMATGSYPGDGAATFSVSGLGFWPDFVIVSSDAGRPSVARSATMPDGLAKRLGKPEALKANCIVSLDADGFTVGGDDDVNKAGTNYYWVAFHASPGVMVVNSYTGNGQDDRSITGLGLQPTYAIVMPAQGRDAQHRMVDANPDRCLQFDNKAEHSNRIQYFASDAFQVGNDDDVNKAGGVYHYVAWASTGGQVRSGYYIGSGFDNRNIGSLGLAPRFAIVRSRTGAGPAVCRTASMSGDLSIEMDSGTDYTNGIQSLRSDGFQVGTRNSVNAFSETYFFITLAPPPGADLGLTKAVDLSAPSEGDTVRYALRLFNYGPDNVSSCGVTDLLPAGLTFLSYSSTQGNYAAGSGSWNVGSLNAGVNAILTLRARINAGTGGTTIVNTGTVTSSNRPDPNSANNSSSASILVRAADLALTKTVDEPAPEIGETVTFTIGLTNNGPNDAEGIAVSDLLPAGLGYVSHTASLGTYGSTTGLWSVGSLGSGLSAQLRITATVNPPHGVTDLTNTASIVAAEPSDPNPANNTASVTLHVARADLALAMAVDRPTANVGQTVTFTITLSNQGPSGGSGIQVTDLLPAGLSYVSHTAGQGTYASGTGIWDVGAVPSGSSVILALAARVDASAGGTTVTNTASVSRADQPDPVASNNAASSAVTVPSANLSISMAVDQPSPNVGDRVTFTITLTDLGPDPASGIRVTDILPAGLTYSSHTVSQGSFASGSGVWNVGSVGPGPDAVLTLSAVVAPSAAGQALTNTATITAADPYDPDASNNAASQTVTVRAADLTLSKSVDRPSPNVGETVTFTITLRNDGPDHATGVSVTDLLPSGLSYSSHTASQGSYVSGTGAWTVGAVNAGAAVTLDLAGVVTPAAGNSVTNTATITAAVPFDPVASNNSASSTITIARADLGLALSVDTANPSVGTTITYSLTLTNNGPATATGIGVTLQLPAGLTYVSHTAGQGSYASGPGLWTVASLASGNQAILNLSARVASGTGGSTITQNAAITAALQADPVASNNSASIGVTVQSADLALSMGVDDPTPNEGEHVTFTLTLTNQGPNPCPAIAVTDLLPEDLIFASSTPSQGTYTAGTGLWSVGLVNAGEAAILSLVATVAPGTGGSIITNSAAVTASGQEDPAGANNLAAVILAVGGADLALSMTVTDETPEEGEPLGYTVILTNLGPNTATGVFVSAPIPQGLSFVSQTPSQGSYSAATGAWSVGTISAGAVASLALATTVNAGTGGQTLEATASLGGSDTADPEPGNNTASRSVTVRSADLALAMTVDDANPEAGAAVTFRLVLRNHGPDAVIGIVVTDLLPEGLTYASSSASQGTYESATGTWAAGSLSAGGEATLDLTATVDAGAVGRTITHQAEITTSPTADPDPADNTAATQIIVRAPAATLRLTTPLVPGQPLRPGGARLTVLRLQAENRSATDAVLTSLVVTNTTSGPGAPNQLDEEWTSLRLRVGGEETPLASSSATFQSGRAVYDGLSIEIAAGATVMIEFEGGASVDARDGDLLDLQIKGPEDLAFAQEVEIEASWPLAPAGSFPVDGMTRAQMGLVTVPATEIFAGDSLALALDFVVPPNGYEADVLESVRLRNLGDAQAGRDLATLQLWADGGDGRSGGSPSDDRLLGSLSWSGGLWSISGLDEPIPTQGLRLFATVSAGRSAVENRTIRLSVPGSPTEGLLVHSGNDGPIDASLDNPASITILGAVEDVIAVAAAPQESRSLLPGGSPEQVLELKLVNFTRENETLRGFTLTNAAVGPGSPADLDADWSALSLRGSIGGEELPEIAVGEVRFVDGRATFSGLAIELPPRELVVLSVLAGASLRAREPDRLDLRVQDAGDFSFGRAASVDGEWPLDPVGSFVVDGMAAAQLTGHTIPSQNLATGSSRNLVFDVTLPANGYEADLLTRFGIRNLGSAAAGDDIATLELWSDDGDGVFRPVRDRLLGSMASTGERWEITALSVPVPIGGLRVFVSAQLGELAGEGRTIRLSLPASADYAIGMASGNDGPRDLSMEGVSTHIITSTNRLTVAAEPLPFLDLHPGSERAPLLQLVVTNTHDAAHVLREITLSNLADGPGERSDLDGQYEMVTLRSDGDGDGIRDDDQTDPVLATGAFRDGRATLRGFSWPVDARESRHLFVEADVSLRGAHDGDLLGLSVDGPLSLFFEGDPSVAGAWPLDSGARGRVDGMVAQQVVNLGGEVATLGPGQGPALALDLLIPPNGYLEDRLIQLVVRNLGTAGINEIARLQLWRDGGDGVFDGVTGGDDDLGRFAFSGEEWVSPSLHEPLQLAGARFFVSLQVADTLTGPSTVRLAVPVNGITVLSDNDGPVNEPISNHESIFLSPTPLRATITTFPSASTIGGEFSVRMAIENGADEAIRDVIPTPLLTEGTANLSRVRGPDPPSLRLAPGERDTLWWTFRGAGVGECRLSAGAEGMGESTGRSYEAHPAVSNKHAVYSAASHLEMFAVGSPPFTVYRGQTGIVPLSLTFRNPGGERSSSVKLTGLRVRLEDENGSGIVPSSLLAGISVREGNRLYLLKAGTDIESSGAEIDLSLTTPVIVSTFEPATLSLLLDISGETLVRGFRVCVLSAGWLLAEDVTSHAPVTVLLQEQTYPLRSGLARLVEEAAELQAEPLPSSTARVAPGKTGVSLFTLRLQNTGIEGISSDVRVTRMAVSLTDTAGVPLADPGLFLQELRVETSLQTLARLPVGSQPADSLALPFINTLTLPVNAPITVSVVGDVAASARVGRIRARLLDPSSFEARDANTRRAVPVRYLPGSLDGGTVSIEEPADLLFARGDAAFPSVVTVGERDVRALTLKLRHPGAPGASRIRLDSLRVECRNGERVLLPPGLVLARAEVRADGRSVGAVNAPSLAQEALAFSIGDVRLEPGESVLLDLFVSIDAAAPASLLELGIAASQIVAVDANSDLAVEVHPDDGGDLPIFSGLTQLKSPPREIRVGLESRLPVSIAADGREYAAIALSFANPALDGSGAVLLDHLRIRAADGERNPIPIGRAVAGLAAFLGADEFARQGGLTPDSTTATLALDPPLTVESGTAVTLEIRLRTREGETVPQLRIGCRDVDIGIVQPEGALLTIQARPWEGQSFPLWSEAAGLSASSLEESYANFPNPFAAGREETTFVYFLPQDATVSLRIWTLRGEAVASLLREAAQAAGLHQTVTWNGRNGRGAIVVNGVYLAELNARFGDGASHRLLRKVAVVR